VEPRDFAAVAAERDLPERDRHRLRSGALGELRRVISETGCSGLAALEGHRVLALVGVDSGQDVRRALDQIGRQACRRVPARLEGLPIVVGTSGEVGVESLKRAFEEAREAVRYGTRVGEGSGMYHFSELGLHHLLLRLSDGHELARFVESELSPLLEHDAGSATPLLRTLATFLNSRSVASAARSLHIERRTLYHRLERIKKLMGYDLDDMDTRTRLTVALRGLELLRLRASHPAKAGPRRRETPSRDRSPAPSQSSTLLASVSARNS
jgi:DNA-binding PucR family transcriptional regulator